MKYDKILNEFFYNIQDFELEDYCRDGISNKLINKRPNISILNVRLNDNTSKSVVIKKKSDMIIFKGGLLLSFGDPIFLMNILMKHKVFGYSKSYLRESCIYENIDDMFRKNLIRYYGSYIGKLKRQCYICLEKCNGRELSAMEDYKKALELITDIQAFYFLCPEYLKKMKVNRYTEKDYKRDKKIFLKLYSKLDNTKLEKYHDEIIDFIGNMDIEYAKHQKILTLTHNDFSVRNIVKSDNILIYDWELACCQNPEHDLIELLVSILDRISVNEVKELIVYFKKLFYSKIKMDLSDEEYQDILKYNILEFISNKLILLRVVNRKMKLNFTDVYTQNAYQLLDLIKGVIFNESRT